MRVYDNHSFGLNDKIRKPFWFFVQGSWLSCVRYGGYAGAMQGWSSILSILPPQLMTNGHHRGPPLLQSNSISLVEQSRLFKVVIIASLQKNSILRSSIKGPFYVLFSLGKHHRTTPENDLQEVYALTGRRKPGKTKQNETEISSGTGTSDTLLLSLWSLKWLVASRICAYPTVITSCHKPRLKQVVVEQKEMSYFFYWADSIYVKEAETNRPCSIGHQGPQVTPNKGRKSYWYLHTQRENEQNKTDLNHHLSSPALRAYETKES